MNSKEEKTSRDGSSLGKIREVIRITHNKGGGGGQSFSWEQIGQQARSLANLHEQELFKIATIGAGKGLTVTTCNIKGLSCCVFQHSARRSSLHLERHKRRLVHSGPQRGSIKVEFVAFHTVGAAHRVHNAVTLAQIFDVRP